VDARPAPDVYDDELWEVVATYRVTLWEQPARRTDIDEPRLGGLSLQGRRGEWAGRR
jgi:hypothetical protein